MSSHRFLGTPLTRRSALGLGLAGASLGLTALRHPSALANALQATPETRTGITAKEWNPQAIRDRAGTLQVDTAAETSKIVPLDYKGDLSYWYAGPNQGTAEIDKAMDDAFWKAWGEAYPDIPLTMGKSIQNLDYNDMLTKVRTAALGGAAPDVARMAIMWGVEFAAKGQLAEVTLDEFGFDESEFWTGALKSVTWQGKLYGIPTNNETMALLWNKALFKKAGLDPETPPKTWDDVVKFSKQIKDETGASGYGVVARPNSGNTPFRFMPVMWAYGGGALDEAEPNPTYDKIFINNEGSIAALQTHYDMYVRDKSAPASALTNTNTENRDLFVSGQLGMMIGSSGEYASMQDMASQATGSDKEVAQEAVDNMGYALIPEGPVRRAVVFGGSNIHIFTDDAAGHKVDRDAARAFIAFQCGPEWSVKLNWAKSNPGNLRGFETDAMKQRLEESKFLDVTTAMLPYGIPFPVIPESTEIMNVIVPDMLQNALTEKMSVKEAADNAADQIKSLLSGL
jgi:multiple sugar transport system substrate-binding protein